MWGVKIIKEYPIMQNIISYKINQANSQHTVPDDEFRS